jgi:hypothetical protein
MLGHVAGGDAGRSFPGEKVDPPAGRIAERGGHRDDRGRKLDVGQLGVAATCRPGHRWVS